MTTGIKRIHMITLGKYINLSLEVFAAFSIPVKENKGHANTFFYVVMFDIHVSSSSENLLHCYYTESSAEILPLTYEFSLRFYSVVEIKDKNSSVSTFLKDVLTVRLLRNVQFMRENRVVNGRKTVVKYIVGVAV